ncbi:carbon-nitrogen family hydrolase [Olea europaea subsp. europaea]|uniref:Carbon-nitrogen family hydrolase n=1 Tax=Olea europaea subsp. europaea TaxID=158383 RepID=A0A8S0UEF4_OLEEU|nr:carbon-nitrogen family hydrolase [Olea europaea subsp. europaea]
MAELHHHVVSPMCEFYDKKITRIGNLEQSISKRSFPVYAEEIDAGFDSSSSTAMLSEVACLLNITIVGGSIPKRSGDKLYNIYCVLGTDGKLKAKHRKLYVASCSPARDVGAGYVSWGHSMLVGPKKPPPGEAKTRRCLPVGRCSEIEFSMNESKRT